MDSLKDARKKAGITQAELVELLGVSAMTYSFKERGMSAFTIGEAIKITEYINGKLRESYKVDEIYNVGNLFKDYR